MMSHNCSGCVYNKGYCSLPRILECPGKDMKRNKLFDKCLAEVEPETRKEVRENMDYKKMYKEALERAKKVKHDVENIGCSMSPDMLELIFPELAESEEEKALRIIKKRNKTPDFVFSKQEYESHPIISTDTTSVKPVEPDGKALLYTADKSYQIGFRDGVASVKPAEWSEEDEEALDMCLNVIPKKWKTKSGILLTKWLKDNIHLQPMQK